MNKEERYELYIFSVWPGWWPILDEYLPQIRAIDPACRFLIKEKFGALRIDTLSEDHSFSELEIAAEHKSTTICECCGAPGRLRTDRSWIQTLCDRCANASDDEIAAIIADAKAHWIKKD